MKSRVDEKLCFFVFERMKSPKQTFCFYLKRGGKSDTIEFIGEVIERPNRFIAYAELNGKKETVHVKNTGRCAELLRPGANVISRKR